jgi:hypothetical protein
MLNEKKVNKNIENKTLMLYCFKILGEDVRDV